MEYENSNSSMGRAMRRLLKDWKEIQENILPNVAAAPLEENMLQWHVNSTLIFSKSNEFSSRTY